MARVQHPHSYIRNPYAYEPRTPGPGPTARAVHASAYYPSMSSPRYPPAPSASSSTMPSPSATAIPRMPGPPFPRPFGSTGSAASSTGGGRSDATTSASAQQERRYEPYRRPSASASAAQAPVQGQSSPHLRSPIAQGTREQYEGYHHHQHYHHHGHGHRHSHGSPPTPHHSRHLSSSSVLDVRGPPPPPPSFPTHAKHHSSPQQQYTSPSQRHASPQQHHVSPRHHYPSPQQQLASPQQLYASPQQQYALPQQQRQLVAAQPRPKAYETSRPTEVYQPSRGAQRDAKWHRKYTERAHLLAGGEGHGGRVPPPHPGPQVQVLPPISSHVTHAPHRPVISPGFAPQLARPLRVSHASRLAGIAQPARPLSATATATAAHAPPYLAHPSQRGTSPGAMEQLRREQAAAIASARKKHQESMRQSAAKEENDRKVRRIQLQVFVHARTTRCLWTECEGVPNSWALLEKHIYHCHLHPDKLSTPLSALAARSRVQCQWDACSEMFDSPNDCYQHVLVGHMGAYSARCPFNCLFEGAKFPDLMAHIGRRHPTATPDDFVPGLIHHRPSYIPPESALPRLPRLVKLAAYNDTASSPFLCGDVRASMGEISSRVRRIVMRGCTSGRRPRKDHFVDKQGASAAIAAIIENSRRIFAAYHSARVAQEDQDGAGISADPPRSANVPMTAAQAMQQGVRLVDVREFEMEAMEGAKEDMRKSARLVIEVESDTTSTEGSRPASRSATRPALEVKVPFTDQAGEPAGDPSSESDASSVSDGSEYRSRAGQAGVILTEGETGVKRSERLKRKAEGAAVGSPTSV